MNRRSGKIFYVALYCVIVIGIVITGIIGSRTVTAISENTPITGRKCVIIDAGHGGVDGGASTKTGIPESQINLDIAIRLNDLMHLLGIHTKMIRTTDCSIHTEGQSIAAKKVSDLKQRVKLVNETNDALLISIHQNYFPDSRYGGAQVFYHNDNASRELAKQLQTAFVESLNQDSNRKAKLTKGVYLFEHIKTTGILVECGFLSNDEESALLLDPQYQKNICCVISSVTSQYLKDMHTIT